MAPKRESRSPASAIDPRLSDASHPVDADNQNLRAALTNSLYPTDNQFAGLVEAATAAAGQETEWSQGEDVEAILARHGQMPQQMGSYATHVHGMPMDMSRLNGSGTEHHYPVEGLQENPKPNTRKRKRVGSAEQQVHFDGDIEIRDLPPQQSLAEARAAGVHSAAALFRRPSSTSKKYTRPPMSTLFGSLELTPENFLHLQAAAKAYMLDDSHPERRDCVGQRGKGDGDMVKLALWHCVEAFLEQDSVGETYFGVNAMGDGIGARILVWPTEKQKIIKAVIPLCRRMVTNERQREYAVRTRKGGGAEKNRQDTIEEDDFQMPHHAQHLPYQQEPLYNDKIASTTPKDSPLPPTVDTKSAKSNSSTALSSPMLQISLLRKSRRCAPRLDLPAQAAPDLSTLRLKIDEHLLTHEKAVVGGHHMDVKIHLPDGLVKVENDGEWTVGVLSAGKVEWMDGEVRIVVSDDGGEP